MFSHEMLEKLQSEQSKKPYWLFLLSYGFTDGTSDYRIPMECLVEYNHPCIFAPNNGSVDRQGCAENDK